MANVDIFKSSPVKDNVRGMLQMIALGRAEDNVIDWFVKHGFKPVPPLEVWIYMNNGEPPIHVLSGRGYVIFEDGSSFELADRTSELNDGTPRWPWDDIVDEYEKPIYGKVSLLTHNQSHEARRIIENGIIGDNITYFTVKFEDQEYGPVSHEVSHQIYGTMDGGIVLAGSEKQFDTTEKPLSPSTVDQPNGVKSLDGAIIGVEDGNFKDFVQEATKLIGLEFQEIESGVMESRMVNGDRVLIATPEGVAKFIPGFEVYRSPMIVAPIFGVENLGATQSYLKEAGADVSQNGDFVIANSPSLPILFAKQ